MAKNLILWVIIAIVLMSVFNSFAPRTANPQNLTYSEFLERIRTGQIKTAVIQEESNGRRSINGEQRDGGIYSTSAPRDTELLNDLLGKDVEVTSIPEPQRSLLMEIFISWFPFLLLIGLWIFFMRQMQGGGGGRGAMSFGKSRARLQGEDQVKVTFADVAGIEEAKQEVCELVEFLRDPGKFQKLGGRIPRGVLLVGAPGTGKTLLGRAIAGEAKVPFYTISGSDFVEMFVGVGASRVRDMFEQAKKHAPCIIFIDEIDAVGRHRGAGLGGGHDEREQTLNQLLVEMDGFESNDGVIIIAATNRPDVLDPALLRPGRFDRQVVVPLPDIRGREQILKVHMRKIPYSSNVDSRVLARGTPGFTGADLANLINEAALFAARENAEDVKMEHLERAKDKIMMGAERRSMAMSEDDKKLTAYHESGHAIVGRLMPDHDPVYKVTIIPRGQALGVTMFLPEEDQHSFSRRQLESKLASAYGGRVAEELYLGKEFITTGASSDIEYATKMARNMVQRWGLSELGPIAFAEQEEEVFLGRSITQNKHMSEETANRVDIEVRRILNQAYARATTVLEENRDKMELMAQALIKYETIDADQIDTIMQGKSPGPPKDWWDSPGDAGKAGKLGDDDSGDKKGKEKASDAGIGEPAEQH